MHRTTCSCPGKGACHSSLPAGQQPGDTPLQINGSDTLHFILDTGSRNTILFLNDSVSNPLHTLTTTPALIRGIGMEQEYIHAFLSRENTVSIGRVSGSGVNILWFDATEFNISGYLGTQVDGILGTDIFHDLVVRVQYEARKLVFEPRGALKLSKKYISLPLQMEQGRAYLEADTDAGSGPFSAKLLIDIGESKPLSLLADTHPQLRYPERFTIASLGVGLGRAISGYIARIPGINVGKYRANDLVVAFPDEQSLPLIHRADGRHGSIGAGLLQKFECVFDFAGARLYLRRTGNLNKPFLYNRLGAEISTTGELHDRFLVNFIIPYTPAEFFGLKKGDEILAVNGRSTHRGTLDQVWRWINDHRNDYITLKVRRNDTVLVVDILLFNIL